MKIFGVFNFQDGRADLVRAFSTRDKARRFIKQAEDLLVLQGSSIDTGYYIDDIDVDTLETDLKKSNAV